MVRQGEEEIEPLEPTGQTKTDVSTGVPFSLCDQLNLSGMKGLQVGWWPNVPDPSTTEKLDGETKGGPLCD